MAKVVLVNPPHPAELRYGHGIDKVAPILPSLGLLYVAAVLEKAGYQPIIADGILEGWTFEDTVRSVMAHEPEIIGITAWTSNFHRVQALCTEFRKTTDRPIILGGPHPSMHPEESASDPNIEAVVIGEGELTAPDLVDVIVRTSRADRAEALAKVPGIAFRGPDGEVRKTEKRPLIQDLDEIPFPARHLIDMGRYRGGPQHAKRFPTATMITTRGCPFSCTFCDAIMIWTRKYRQRTVDNVLEEIQYLQERHGVRDIGFWDDLWGLNKNWVREFHRKVKERKIDITWSCECRVDTVNPELLGMMADSGCWCIFYGVESMDEEILEIINKDTNLEKIENAMRWTKEAGIEIRANFIVGLPKETPAKMKAMLPRIRRLDLDYVKFNILTPYPGTPLYHEVKSGKWGKMTEDWDRLTGYFATFVPDGYKNLDEVQEMQRYLRRGYYLRPGYVWSRLKRTRNLSDIGRYFDGLKALLAT